MSNLASELVSLPPERRLELIERLWESLDDADMPVTEAQKAELSRRIASFDEERDHGVTWEELRSELRQQQ
jgi:putative addiction module component (TIGR02574 family)